MARFIDARIPVVFDTEPEPADQVVRPDADWSQAHPAGCTCCTTRGPAALALDRLFLDRVHGAASWSGRLVVLGDGASVRQALAEDPLAGSRFRLDQASRK